MLAFPAYMHVYHVWPGACGDQKALNPRTGVNGWL